LCKCAPKDWYNNSIATLLSEGSSLYIPFGWVALVLGLPAQVPAVATTTPSKGGRPPKKDKGEEPPPPQYIQYVHNLILGKKDDTACGVTECHNVANWWQARAKRIPEAIAGQDAVIARVAALAATIVAPPPPTPE
jgi:hypothetical protein